MKKLIYVLILFSSILSFFTAYNKVDTEQINKIMDVEGEIGYPFEIPNDLAFANPEEMSNFLKKISKDLKVNIFRENMGSDLKGDFEITKSILLNTNTNFYDYFNIKNNVKLPEESNNKYISNKDTHNKNQIGTINILDKEDTIKIQSLDDSYRKFPVHGTYYVELPNNLTFNEFIDKFVSETNKTFHTKFPMDDFLAKNITNSYQKASNDYWIMLYLFVLISISFLVIYNILNSSKKISIYKLNGVSNFKIWTILNKSITIVFWIINGILLLISMIYRPSLNLLYHVFLYQLIGYLIITALSLLTYFYIKSVKIDLAIKNKKDTTSIFILNSILKIAFAIILIVNSITLLNEYFDSREKLNNLKNWSESSEYGVFYPLQIGNDSKQLSNDVDFQSKLNTQLYSILNKQGALLIDTKSYEELDLRLNAPNADYIINSISINPNYLNKYPIYDANNKVINIPDSYEDSILIVPEKYKDHEKDILEYFKEERNDSIEAAERFLNTKVDSKYKNQSMKIIWSKDNQKIFSFNPEVFKSEYNEILDPIIKVITENNSVLTERNTILGGGALDPLKIKLIDNDPEKTYKSLEDTLKSLNLDDNLKYLVTVNDVVFQDIYVINQNIKITLSLSLAALVCFCIIAFQNISLFFNKNSKKFIIKRLFGCGLFKVYNKFFAIFLATWIIQILISIIIYKKLTLELTLVLLGFIIIELIYSCIVLTIVEKRNKLNIIKGE